MKYNYSIIVLVCLVRLSLGTDRINRISNGTTTVYITYNHSKQLQHRRSDNILISPPDRQNDETNLEGRQLFAQLIKNGRIKRRNNDENPVITNENDAHDVHSFSTDDGAHSFSVYGSTPHSAKASNKQSGAEDEDGSVEDVVPTSSDNPQGSPHENIEDNSQAKPYENSQGDPYENTQENLQSQSSDDEVSVITVVEAQPTNTLLPGSHSGEDSIIEAAKQDKDEDFQQNQADEPLDSSVLHTKESAESSLHSAPTLTTQKTRHWYEFKIQHNSDESEEKPYSPSEEEGEDEMKVEGELKEEKVKEEDTGAEEGDLKAEGAKEAGQVKKETADFNKGALANGHWYERFGSQHNTQESEEEPYSPLKETNNEKEEDTKKQGETKQPDETQPRLNDSSSPSDGKETNMTEEHDGEFFYSINNASKNKQVISVLDENETTTNVYVTVNNNNGHNNNAANDHKQHNRTDQPGRDNPNHETHVKHQHHGSRRQPISNIPPTSSDHLSTPENHINNQFKAKVMAANPHKQDGNNHQNDHHRHTIDHRIKKPTLTASTCNHRQCASERKASVHIHTGEGKPVLVPWGENVTLECSVAAQGDVNLTILWLFEYTGKSSSSSETATTRQPHLLKEELLLPASGSNETVEVTSQLNNPNVNAVDSGFYTCVLVVNSKPCCHLNHTMHLGTYAPPHYTTDVTIIVCIVIIEALLVFYAHSRKVRESRKDGGNVKKEPKISDIPMQTFEYKPIRTLPEHEENGDDDEENIDDEQEVMNKSESKA